MLLRDLETLSLNLPGPLESETPNVWTMEDDTLIARAGPHTDLFIDPLNPSRRELNAPMLLFPLTGDFLLSARVQVEFASDFDAGVLILHQDDDNWAKLCFEYSPAGQPMIVSVVTKGSSDDCNSAILDTNTVFLRVAKIRSGFAFHYAVAEDRRWEMVRAFSLPGAPTRAGFLAQSPKGPGCTVRFRDIRYYAATLQALRSGE